MKRCVDCKTTISARATRCRPCHTVASGKKRRKTMEQRLEGSYREEDRGFETPCWIWIRATDRKGYGHIHLGKGRMKPAHVAHWELVHGEVPPGHDLHHRCEVHLCVNPDHTEPLTRREHMRRDGRMQRLVDRNKARARAKRGERGDTRDRDRHGAETGGADRQATGGVGEERRKVLVLRAADGRQDLHDRSLRRPGERRHG